MPPHSKGTGGGQRGGHGSRHPTRGRHPPTALGAAYRLRPADAVHLATAVNAGADRFITTNASAFPKTIVEIDITYPVDLTG